MTRYGLFFLLSFIPCAAALSGQTTGTPGQPGTGETLSQQTNLLFARCGGPDSPGCVRAFLSPGSSFGRQPAPQASEAVAPAELISRAADRAREYRERFKDLTAEETQRVEEYGDKGPKRRREVVSDLIIYQSQLDSSAAAEYRNVRLVDGKEVSGRDRRVEQLFGRLAGADSRKKELERIQRESKRYDLSYSVYGLTLNQGMPLAESVRQSFRFTVTGGGQIEGHDVIEVRYVQVSQTPELNTEFSSLPQRLKGAEMLYRGRLWLDRETARLRREEREWTLKARFAAGPADVHEVRAKLRGQPVRYPHADADHLQHLRPGARLAGRRRGAVARGEGRLRVRRVPTFRR